MAIQLSDHFTTGKLLRFTLPSIAMMIFTSIYSVAAEVMAVAVSALFLVLKRNKYHYF